MARAHPRTTLAAALLALVVAWPGTPPGFVVDSGTGAIAKPDPVLRPSLAPHPVDDEHHRHAFVAPAASAVPDAPVTTRAPIDGAPPPPVRPPRTPAAARAPPRA